MWSTGVIVFMLVTGGASPFYSRNKYKLARRSVRGHYDIEQFGSAVSASASKSSIRRFVITEKAPTRAFSWLNAATTAFTFKTLLRHYAKRALTPRSLNVKLCL